MKKEHEEYFSKKLNELADKFNAAVDQHGPGQKFFEAHPELGHEIDLFAICLYNEFKLEGYTDKDWNALEDSSGVKKRMADIRKRM